MNYGISVLFRAIPLAMALFCFFYGGFIYFWGDDSSRMIAGPVVFFLGSICLALYATAVTIIRQIIGTYSTFAKYFLPIMAYAVAIFTFVFGTAIFSDTAHAEYFVAGHARLGTRAITGASRPQPPYRPFQADYREQRRSDARRQSRRLLPATGVNFRDRGRVLCGRSMGMDFHPAGRPGRRLISLPAASWAA